MPTEMLFVTVWRVQTGESVCSSREGHLADSLRMHTAALRSFALRNSTDLMDGAHLGHRHHSNGLYTMDHSMHNAGKHYSHTDLVQLQSRCTLRRAKEIACLPQRCSTFRTA